MKCKICGGDTQIIHIGTRDRSDINVHECNSCHTKQLSEFDKNDYENGFMNGMSSMTSEEIVQRLASCEADDFRRAAYMKAFINNKTVLDFGCGFGGFLKCISEFDNVNPKYISGVELSTDEFHYVNSHGIHCTKTIEEQKNDFDYITLFHVFEHLDNPLEWLNILSNHINDDGRIIIEVPNSNDALLSRYNCEKFADFTYWSAHLFLYSVEGFKALVSQTDKVVIDKIEQVQRYPLANHLYWLSQGKPGGQAMWSCLTNNTVDGEYKKLLEDNFECDTLLFTLKKNI